MTTTYPEKFPSVIQDFIQDLSIPFPEYSYLWSKWGKSEEVTATEWQNLYDYCLSVYPERFFDVLYENEEIFLPDSNTNTLFLPCVEFKLLYNCEGVTENTKKSIWKYIQLILFTIIGNVKDKEDFGKSMNLFEGIDEKELQEKLTETMSGIGDFFKNLEKGGAHDRAADGAQDRAADGAQDRAANGTETSGEKSSSFIPPNMDKILEEMEAGLGAGFGAGLGQDPDSASKPEVNQFFEKMFGDMGGMKGMKEQFEKAQSQKNGEPDTNSSDSYKTPNPDDIHNHLKDLFGGKLGGLAKELVDELSEELKEGLGLDDLNSSSTSADVFQKLMKNPDKFMNIVKKINTKFQEKMKRGDISQEDLMKEAGEMLKKMKEMGGGNSKQMNEMFQNMAKSMGGSMGSGFGGKNTRVDTNAMDRMMKQQSTKERMRAKLEQKKQQQQLQITNNYTVDNSIHQTEKANRLVYRPQGAEAQERSMIKSTSTPAVPYVEKDLDALVAEIEGTGPSKNSVNQNKKKKNKGKK
jgi:hypothetical protein